MRSPYLFILALLIGAMVPGLAYSQVPATAGECPTVYVAGPAGITAPGEIYWFEATVKGRDGETFEYDWVVSIGKITERVGKTRIGVLATKEMADTSVTATVRVKGLPDGCENVASESSGICDCSPEPMLIDEFSIAASKLNLPSLGAAVVELEDSRNSQLYIIEYFPSKTTKAVVDRKITAIRKHLSEKHKFDLKRVTIVSAHSENDETLTKIYKVPPGAQNPSP